jgi:23S rRNA (uracil1939-C5)-methyltransferase
MKKEEPAVYKKITVTDAGAEGKAVARAGDLVIFVPYAAPGDVADLKIIRRKRSYLEARAVHFHTYSSQRTEPFCSHFGLCGGCSWQHLAYEHQLFYKQKQVADHFTRIGKVAIPVIEPIIPSPETQYYRNKLEYTFSNRRWLTGDDLKAPNPPSGDALGFHVPRVFSKVIDIQHCYLQKDPSNAIRTAVRQFALDHGMTFHDVRNNRGLLRNLIIRTTTGDDLMVVVVFGRYDEKESKALLGYLAGHFPEITSLMYVVNMKKNDIITDLDAILYRGRPYIIETMKIPGTDDKIIKFKIGPVSFFQTNPYQASRLYAKVFEYAQLTGRENVYDLYSGTGAIANILSHHAARVTGIEYVTAAVEDARENAAFNGIANTTFIAGDMSRVLGEAFTAAHGRPDVVITDPPRAGMHEKVVRKIMAMTPSRIVYISCNPATQARDIALMDDRYAVVRLQPVDMFPHTHHVENIALLVKRNG